MLFAERMRKEEDKRFVLETLNRIFKCSVDPQAPSMYAVEPILTQWQATHGALPPVVQQMVWTRATQRLFVLAHRAVLCDEPVLLVGSTGVGKTTLVQCLNALFGKVTTDVTEVDGLVRVRKTIEILHFF